MKQISNLNIKYLLVFLFGCLLSTTIFVLSKNFNNNIEDKIVFLDDGSIEVLNPPNSLKMYELSEINLKKHNIPRYIFYNIAYLETKYRGPFHWDYIPYQTSFAGAVGPMQIMPETANMIHGKKIKIKDLKCNIKLNIETSAMLLEKLYKKYKDWKIVCGCYNTGKPIINDYAVFCSSNKDYRKNWIKY